LKQLLILFLDEVAESGGIMNWFESVLDFDSSFNILFKLLLLGVKACFFSTLDLLLEDGDF
jgi:hypothetical protein